ncbi:MAG: M42 family metallopeptidase [Lachnospiraceae bacterium]|nr:M42 family metallopeptidase [Lachnospiraceae bacterium]
MKTSKYVYYAVEMTKKLLAIDSPSGYTKKAADFVVKEYEKMGYKPQVTTKGSVIVDIGGKDKNNALLLAAHVDTLGAMVHTIKDNGNLKLDPIGGLSPNNTETENVKIVTKANGTYEGTYQLTNASIHVNGEFDDTKRSWDNMEVVLDQPVKSKEDTEKLGIMPGDYVCFNPRTVVTKSGYIKSRFLDDKLSVGILLAYAKYLKEENKTLDRKQYHYITVYEEEGHGCGSSIPAGVTEAISVDMGCVGEGLNCTERQVSICAKSSRGPYNYEIVSNLIAIAKRAKLDFAVDIYPHYGSDVDIAVRAGFDVKHGLIGAGVYASHGYERSHIDGVANTLELIALYAK